MVEPDYPRGALDELGHDLPGATLGPVRLLREKAVDRRHVDACPGVVELEAAAQLAPHHRSVAARGIANPTDMEREVRVAEVKALKTRSGNTRYVLRDEDGGEYS